MALRLTVFLLLLAPDPAAALVLYPFQVDAVLNGTYMVSVNWEVDYDSSRVNLAVEVKPSVDIRWFGIGFSDVGDFENSDLCVFDEDKARDSWIDKWGSIREDEEDDCENAQREDLPGERTIFTFSRVLDTCHPHDYIITRGTTQILVAIGTSYRKNIFGRRVLKKIIPNRLLKTLEPPTPLPPETQTFVIAADQAPVPAKETTYWCTVNRLPRMPTQNHVIRFEAAIDPGHEALVHHVEVYHCEMKVERMPRYNGPCTDQDMPEEVKACKRVIAAWAMGAEPFIYPEETGLPIGGPGYFPFVMIELHYNNPQLKEGLLDSSGIRFFHTPHQRPTDAGILEVGLIYTDSMAIPPKVPAFPLTGYCTPDCTDAGLPDDGITIFGTQLHAHLTGHRLETVQSREGEMVAIVNRDLHFTTHWQEIRKPYQEPIRVMPGDALLTTCIYDTHKKVNVTLGGLGINDEMCVNYIHYYPRAPLEVCKSAIDRHALNQYFDAMASFESQPTSSANTAAANYRTIHWNRQLASQLYKVYQKAPIRMDCLQNNGQPFPGNWDNLKIPRVFKRLPPETTQCSVSYLDRINVY